MEFIKIKSCLNYNLVSYLLSYLETNTNLRIIKYSIKYRKLINFDQSVYNIFYFLKIYNESIFDNFSFLVKQLHRMFIDKYSEESLIQAIYLYMDTKRSKFFRQVISLEKINIFIKKVLLELDKNLYEFKMSSTTCLEALQDKEIWNNIKHIQFMNFDRGIEINTRKEINKLLLIFPNKFLIEYLEKFPNSISKLSIGHILDSVFTKLYQKVIDLTSDNLVELKIAEYQNKLSIHSKSIKTLIITRTTSYKKLKFSNLI